MWHISLLQLHAKILTFTDIDVLCSKIYCKMNILQNQLKMFGRWKVDVYYIYIYAIIFIRVRCSRPAGSWRRQDTVFYSQLLLSVWSSEMNKMLRVTK